jgi:hypothetical protein
VVILLRVSASVRRDNSYKIPTDTHAITAPPIRCARAPLPDIAETQGNPSKHNKREPQPRQEAGESDFRTEGKHR